MADELHASLTPNVVNVGETLEVEIDSSAAEWQNADSAVIRIFEIDEVSPFEPDKHDPSLVVTCEGKIVDNQFSLTPAAEGKSNPNVSSAGLSGAPIVKLAVGGTTVDVPLPNKEQEQGVFELRIELEIKKPKAKKFTSKTSVMVRSFDHFTVNGDRRPVVAFVTGGRDDSYFQTASRFWRMYADVVVSAQGMSLQAILEMLDAEHEKFGKWGQVNIIAHGRARAINIKLFKDSEAGIHRDKVAEEVKDHANMTPPVELERPGGLDGETQIVIRACNAGRDAELIEALHFALFDGYGTLFVPKFVQVYHYSRTDTTVEANEWFEECLTFDTPGSTAPSEDAIQAGLAQAWDALDSPGKGGDRDVEIPLFADNQDWIQTFSYVAGPMSEGSVTKADGSIKTNAELVDDFRRDWSVIHKLDTSSKSWDTPEDRWEISIGKTVTNTVEPRQYVVEIEKGISDPKFVQFSEKAINVGSVAAEDIWVVEAEGVADFHFSVEFGPGPKEATVYDANSGEPTFVGKTQLVDGAEKKVELPVTIKFGKAQLKVRQGAPAIDIHFECKRHHVDRRRQLRLFDANEAYADRQLVVPKVQNPDHYGSS